jgi:MFS family permease
MAEGDPLPVVTRRRLTLVATIVGSSLAFVDASVVFIALPTIERDLDIGFSGEQWVFLSYSLALASLYLVAGATGDRIGRRKTFVAGCVGFALASALAGAAPDEAFLIAARTLQGVAGAFVTTNSPPSSARRSDARAGARSAPGQRGPGWRRSSRSPRAGRSSSGSPGAGSST